MAQSWLGTFRRYFSPSADDRLNLTKFQVIGKSSDDSSALANHRAQVYQRAYLQILGSAIYAARKNGAFTFNDGSPSPCSAKFNILIAILDYEEA